MTIAPETYDDLLNHVYDAALDPAAWPRALEQIALAFQASGAVIYTFMHSVERGGFAMTYRLPQEVLEAWARISVQEDPFVQALLSRQLLADGAAWEGTQLVPYQELVKSRLYTEVWRFHGIEHMAAGCIFAGSDGHHLPTSISLYRGPTQPAYTGEEIELLSRLIVHLSRALGVMFHLRDEQHQLAASRAALARLGAGVLLLGPGGEIRFANPAAQAMLDRGEVVQARREPGGARTHLKAAATLGPQQARLDAAVAAALAPPAEDAGEHFSACVTLDDAGRPAVVVHAAPLRSSRLSLGEDAAAIVFLYDLDRDAVVDTPLLRRLFGLTPAEARLVQALAEGGAQDEVAKRLKLSTNTVKTQLRAVYAKTNTHRQADLLKLVLSLSQAGSGDSIA